MRCGFLAKDTPIDSLVVGGARRRQRRGLALAARCRGGAGAYPRRAPPPPQEASGLEQLSEREVDVLRLIANGLENAEIATELNISPRTAKNHVSNILAKLGLPSRVQAAVYAVRQGVS